MHRLFEPSPVRYLYYALGNVDNLEEILFIFQLHAQVDNITLSNSHTI